jgi:hypothetical protein
MSLISEVQALNADYAKNAEQIEKARALDLETRRATAVQEAIAEITKDMAETIKSAAKQGRKLNNSYVPRTECMFYKWSVKETTLPTESASGAAATTADNESEAADDDDQTGLNRLQDRPNKFGGFYLNDLMRNGRLLEKLQDWFDVTHPASAATSTATSTDTTQKPQRAFRVFWNSVRRQPYHYALFVNWSQDRQSAPQERQERQERFERRPRGPPDGRQQHFQQQQQQQQQQSPHDRRVMRPRIHQGTVSDAPQLQSSQSTQSTQSTQTQSQERGEQREQREQGEQAQGEQHGRQESQGDFRRQGGPRQFQQRGQGENPRDRRQFQQRQQRGAQPTSFRPMP